MEKLGGSRSNNPPSYSQPWYRIVFNHGIHILLVDHDKECLNSTAELLELCAYKVTKVEHASTALNMLRAQKKQFEVVIADIHSPDLHENHLFQEAVKMDLLVILTSSNEETLLANRAIENGALMFVHKPINIELVKYLWQLVLRDRSRKNKEKVTVGENKDAEENNGGGENDANTNVTGKRKVRNGKMPMEDQKNQEADANCGKAEKVCTVQWTTELHAKFMDAVGQLGEGRCYPKEILERMNVPGLTRMQVASHLQKCRHENWRPRGERSRYKKAPPPESSKNDYSQEKDNVRRFGSMPRSCKAIQPENQENSATTRNNLALGNNNISADERGESSRQNEVSQITGQQGSMEMLNGNPSYFVCPVDKSHGNDKGILVPTGIPAITNALYMTSEFFGPNLLAFGSTCTTLITPYGDLPNRRRPSEDFFELGEDMDFLVNDPPELEQWKGSNDGHSQIMACFDQVNPEKLLQGINDEAGCQVGSKATKFAGTSRNAP